MKNLKDIYPLSPMQELMLVHLLAERDSTLLIEQACYTLDGELDVESFRTAWQHVIDRHPMLRTVFLTEGLERPLQVVRERASLALDEHDWQGLSDEEWYQRLEVFLEEDRRRGFDPTQAPLMRLGLMRLDGDRYCFVTSMHHVLLDRWSVATILNEAISAYESLRRGQTPELPRVVPYRDYVEWFQQQDLAEDESYWRSRLAGFMTPTPLPFGADAAPAGSFNTQQLSLDPTTFSTLESFARRQRVTMNVLVQAVWGMVLAGSSGERDVVFGATVSGRPAELPGVESVVGLFINNLPVRVTIAPDEPVRSWLDSLQEQHRELQQHEHTPLAVVQQCSELTAGRLLFDSLLVFQNDPVRSAAAPGESPSLAFRPVWGKLGTKFALTLNAIPSDGLLVLLTYDRNRFEEATIATLLRNMERLFEGIAADPSQRLEALLSGLDQVSPPVQASPVTPPSAPVSAPKAGADVDPPQTEFEVAIAQNWQDVLGVERVDLHDNFFELGGTSVLVLQSISKLERTHGISLSPFQIMTQTLRQLAAACSGRPARRPKRKWWWSTQRRSKA